MEEAKFSELREKINSWDIQAEEMLIQKVKFFTLKYNDEFQVICKNFDNFTNSISSVEFEHLKAVNQLKNLSNERFIEQSLDKSEPKPQEEDNNINNILISDPEKKKKAMEIALPFIETLSKKNKKEVIEDDTASVQSSKITMDKNTKGVKLPHIIGTELFKADKAIGLDVPPDDVEEKEKEEDDDEEEFNPELDEIMSGNVVSQKQKDKWEKIRQKKERQKQKMKEKLQKQKTKNNPQNTQPEKEPEVNVPIENEEEPKQQEDNNTNVQNQQNVKNEPIKQQVQQSDNIKVVANSGGSIPPPPPPPPKPVFTGVPPKKQQPKKQVQNPSTQNSLVQNSLVQQNPANENPLNQNIPSENAQPNSIPIPEVKPPVVNKPMSFEEQLRSRIMNRGGGATNVNTNNNNNTIANNNLNNTNNNDNSNNSNTINTLMSNIQTSADNKNPLAPVIHNNNVVVTKQSIKLNNFMGGTLGDEEDDDDDIDIKASIFNHQKKVNQNKPIMINAPPKQEPIQAQISNNIPPSIKEEPNEEEQKPIQNQVIQPQKEIISQPKPQKIKPPETQFIKIKQNENLKKAGNKMKSIFESDDEEESKPENIVDKTKDLTLKLSTFGIISNPPPTNNIQKPEDNKPKPKKSFFNDEDDDDTNKKEIPKVEPQQPPKKPKISFFNDNDNDNNDVQQKNENKTVPPPQKKQPDFLSGLKEKLMQKNQTQIIMKNPETKIEEKPPQIEEQKIEENNNKDIPVSLTMKEGDIKQQQPQTKNTKNSYLRFSTMLASKLGQGMMMGAPKPKAEEEKKAENIVPPTKVKATYEEVIEAKKTKVVKKKKPKRVGTFGTGELIPFVKKQNPPPEEPIKEEPEQNKEEPKLEEIKQEEVKVEEPKNEEVKVEEPKVDQPKQEENKIEEPKQKESIEQPKPNPEPEEKQDKLNEIKNSVFMLFNNNKEKEEQKFENLFQKIDLEAMPEVKEAKLEENNNNNKIDLFNNNAPKEVQKSKLFFLEDDEDNKPPSNKINNMFGEQSEKNANDNKNKIQAKPSKKKLAFFDDDD